MKPIVGLVVLAVTVVAIQAAPKFVPLPANAPPIVYPETDPGKFLVTFVELGSVDCIPCKKMQPIMKEIEQEYAGKVRVVFYDVWQDRRPAEHYRIDIIPTQIFLDRQGKEILRHEGFFPKAEIVKILKAQGV